MRHQPLLPKTTQNHRVTPVTPDSESPIGERYIIVSARGVTSVTLGHEDVVANNRHGNTGGIDASNNNIEDNQNLSSYTVIHPSRVA